MKRSLLRLCQSREKAAVSSSYQGVVCEADAASVASQDVFKVSAEGQGGGGGAEGWVVGARGTEAGAGQDDARDWGWREGVGMGREEGAG